MGKIWKTYQLSILLLASMVVGAIIGILLGKGASVLQPVADLFLHLLYCCVIPLVFCSLIAAITKMSNLVKLRKILISFLGGTFVTGVISSLFMLVAVLLVNPALGYVLDRTASGQKFEGKMDLLGMFTVGDFPELFSRKNMMALIVFAILVAFGILMAGEKGKPVARAMDALTEVIINVISIVMKIAPIGLGCYFIILTGTYGDKVIGPLSTSIILFATASLVYFVFAQTAFAYIGAGLPGVRRWWKTCLPAALTALGTCSSAASIPVNLLHAKKIGIPEEVADVAIPLGANLHKDGACMTQILKIAFICSVFGVPFTTPQNFFLALLIAVIASIVVGGIPGGGYIAEIFIVSMFGFPQEAIPIMVLIGTITDPIATVVNVTGDTGLAMVIARITDGREWFKRAREAGTDL